MFEILCHTLKFHPQTLKFQQPWTVQFTEPQKSNKSLSVIVDNFDCGKVCIYEITNSILFLRQNIFYFSKL